MSIRSNPEGENINRSNFTIHEIDYVDCRVQSSSIGRLFRKGNLSIYYETVHLGDFNLDRSFVMTASSYDIIQLQLTDFAYSEFVKASISYNEKMAEYRKQFKPEAVAKGLKGFRVHTYARMKATNKIANEILKGNLGPIIQRTNRRREEFGRGYNIYFDKKPISYQIQTRTGYGEKLLNFLRNEKNRLTCN